MEKQPSTTMEKGILLKDMLGEKSESVLGGIVRRVVGRPSTTNILKGELLEQIPGDGIVPRNAGQNFQKPFNYRLVKDPAVAVYCSEYDVAPLSDKEILLLEAIQSQSARYEVFIAGNKMEWGCGLKPGDPVCVSIPGLMMIPNQCATAVIRYVGGLPPDPGLMFGIEITDQQYRGLGYTDGTFCDVRYFNCEDECGLFVALDKLSIDPEGNTLEAAPRGGQNYAKSVSHGSATSDRLYPQGGGPPADNTRARSQAVQQQNVQRHDDRLPRYKKGDRVVAFDKTGNRIHGTVRWIGTTDRTQHFIVGIETDVAVRTRDFEGAMPGLTRVFPAAKHHYLFIPEIGAIEEAAGTNVDKPHPTDSIDVAKEMGISRCEESQQEKSLQEQLVQQREEATQTRQQLQQLQQRLEGANSEKKNLQEQLVQQREEATQTRQQLQQQLDDASAELQGLQDIEPWKVSRDKVEIWTEIGTGGWGSVSEGTLRVAIKQLHCQILSSHYVDRLQREMRMLAQVRHPNLVQFLGVVLDEAALRLQEPPMIITELLDVNLRNAYERKLAFNKLSVFRDVARALNYLHQRHDPIIHRDVSAPNVLLEALPSGMWKGKVSDLGSANLAKLAHTLAEGAIIYAAPETLPQLAHQGHDPHSPPPPQTTKIDVYSYGVLLCEVVTSRFPDPAQYHDMLGQVQREWPFMYGLILSCTKYNSVERPTMAEVLTKLIQP